MRSRARIRRTAALLLVTAVLAWWLSGVVVVAGLLRRDRPVYAEPLPAVDWGSLEEHRLRAADGQEIGCWYSEGEPDEPAVVLLHGNQGSRTAMLGRIRPLVERGLTVLAPSLRAHGDSTGERNDFGYGARLDVVACVRFLAARAPERPIVVHGLSLGAAAAVFAAAELGTDVAAYVLEAPYADLGTAAWNRVRMQLPAPLDAIAWGALRAAQPLFLDGDQVSVVATIADVPASVPVLLLVGTEDRHATPEEARAIYERLGENGRLVEFRGGGHARLPTTHAELYWESFDRLLEGVRATRDDG